MSVRRVVQQPAAPRTEDYSYGMLGAIMKVYVLYRPKSEHSRKVEEFLHELERRHSEKHRLIEVVDIDSRDGTATASLYDIMAYPAILALGNDGQLLKSWVGEEVPPLLNEVTYYIQP